MPPPASASGPLRVRRRRGLASALRWLLGGRRTAGTGAIGARLAEIALARTRPIAADCDLAEFVAHLNLNEMIPADVVVAIAAALQPVLIADERTAAPAQASRGRR